MIPAFRHNLFGIQTIQFLNKRSVYLYISLRELITDEIDIFLHGQRALVQVRI